MALAARLALPFPEFLLIPAPGAIATLPLSRLVFWWTRWLVRLELRTEPSESPVLLDCRFAALRPVESFRLLRDDATRW